MRDELARLPGVGDIFLFGARDYSMRLWLDPQKLASRSMTAGDVVRAVREQNVQVAAGVVGAAAAAAGDRRLPTHRQRAGPADRPGAVRARSSSRPARTGEITRVRDVARVELGAADYSVSAYATTARPSVGIADLPAPRLQRDRHRRRRLRQDGGAEDRISRRASSTPSRTTRRSSSARASRTSSRRCSRRSCWS